MVIPSVMRRVHGCVGYVVLHVLLVAGCVNAPAVEDSQNERSHGLTGSGTNEVGIVLGAADALVEITEYSDFACRYCASFARHAFPVLVEEYVDAGMVRWRYVPISLVNVERSTRAAMAAECVAVQDAAAFWVFKDFVYATLYQWQTLRDPDGWFRLLAQAIWERDLSPGDRTEEDAAVSGENTVDLAAFTTCLESDARRARLAAARSAAIQAGVPATPSFLIDGRLIVGSHPVEVYRAIIDSVLATRSAGRGSEGR